MHCTRISGITAAAAAKKQLSCQSKWGSQTWSGFLYMEKFHPGRPACLVPWRGGESLSINTKASPPFRVAWEERKSTERRVGLFHFFHDGQLILDRTTIIAASHPSVRPSVHPDWARQSGNSRDSSTVASRRFISPFLSPSLFWSKPHSCRNVVGGSNVNGR